MGYSATYSCTALMGTNKTGVLKCDKDGYYEITLGALDFFNSAGAFYVFEGAKHLFEESSSLMRRIRNGSLKGEYGHPKFLPGMSKRDFIARILTINEDCISHHIRNVKIETEKVKGQAGERVIAIMGEVKPAGPHGPALKESFENRHENVCFSIRSMTNDVYDHRGVLTKTLQEIITWDYVNEPGISVANKFQAPGLEARQKNGEILATLEDVSFTFENLMEVRKLHESMKGVGVESSMIIDNVIKALGWDKPKQNGRGPISSRW